ncbi:MAG: hypothetical protein AAFV43_09050 [Planctomycetota bacterium]
MPRARGRLAPLDPMTQLERPLLTREEAADAPCFGYLLVSAHAEGALVGGCLLVCPRGRPIEFHCTEAVTPTRAQQILFGATLPAYLAGEVIGGALLRAATRRPAVLVVEDRACVAAGVVTQTPVVVVREGDPTPAELASLAEAIDVREPFTRVREAIAETQRFQPRVIEDAA